MSRPVPTSPGVQPPGPPGTPRPARLRRLAAPFRGAWRWFAHQPRALQVGLVAVVLAALGAGGYYGYAYTKRAAAAGELAAAWNEYANATRKFDLDGVRAALDRVEAAAPGDPTAARYKAALDRGEAHPDTPELANVLLYHHVAHNRLPEAAREGEKVLAKNPKDWQARCVVAHYALQVRRDRALAEQHLNQLPDPEDPEAHVGPGGLLYALQLSAQIGRDAGPLRRVIVRRLLPLLRGGTAAAAPALTKVQLLECYLEPFADSSALGELADYWVPADKLADAAVTEAAEAGDVSTLARLGALRRPMRVALVRLREHDPARLPDDRLAALAKAVDDRTRRAWQAVRQKAPDRTDAYIGLAQLALAANDPNGALREVLDGLTACDNPVELLALRAQLVASFGTTDNLKDVYRSLLEAAQATKTDPAKWYLVATVANALDRDDVALEACRLARLARPDHPAVCQFEAWLWIRKGEFVRARETLLPLGEAARRTHPGLAQLYARAMAETLWVLIDDEFNAVLEAQAKLNSPTSAPAAGFLLGVLAAAPDRERAEWVARHAVRVPADAPGGRLARRLRAEALFRLADLSVTPNPKGGPPVWDVGLVAAALRAFEELPPEERTEPSAAAAVSALQLKGQGNAATALRTAGALRAAEASLNAWQLEILGVVLTANGRAAEAVAVLERAARLPDPPAGVWVALAVAYHKNNQPEDARAARDRADATPNRSAREQAELVAAKQLLQRENP